MKTKKLDMKSKLKHATLKEMSQLIIDLAKEHPDSESLAQFEPENMPRLVPINWLRFCWHCGVTDGLEKCDDLKLCRPCRGKEITRDVMMGEFGFTKGEAMKLNPKRGSNGR